MTENTLLLNELLLKNTRLIMFKLFSQMYGSVFNNPYKFQAKAFILFAETKL